MRFLAGESSERRLRLDADSSRDRGDYALAADLYTRVLNLTPKDGPIHVQCGHMHKENGQMEDAERHYRSAFELMPENADLSLQLGHFFKVNGRLQEALAMYYRAVTLKPGWPEAISEFLSLSAIVGRGVDRSGNVEVDRVYEEAFTYIFDKQFYNKQAGHTTTGYGHYAAEGWKAGLDPHPLFSTSYYVSSLGRPLQGNPLEDFIRVGSRSFAEIHPLIDVRKATRYASSAGARNLHPLMHLLCVREELHPDSYRFFDLHYYLGQVPGLNQAEIHPLVHYLQFGWEQGLRPHRHFDPKVFSAANPVISKSDPLTEVIRWLLTGENRKEEFAPEVSIIVLNLEKALLTIQCLYFVSRFTDRSKIEIILLDNGSSLNSFKELCFCARMAKIIRSDVNLGFGEANNVAAENASGHFLLFLNNDVFVSPGWLEPLLEQFAEDDVGAAGPTFFYPDGRVQEAGARVHSDGHVHQRGRGLPALPERYRRSTIVDYVSAACLLMRSNVFSEILGFDLIWDPAYYEDVDLCCKIRLLGKRIRYVPNSSVIHLENSTSSDQDLRLKLDTVVAANRIKFANRWGNFIESGLPADAPSFRAPVGPDRAPASRPCLALFTPYPLTPGGGERYLLSFAHVFRDEFDCILYTPQPTSRLRLQTLGRELDLKLDHIEPCQWQYTGQKRQPDVFIAIGNEVLPFAVGIGKRNFFVCQFPFPMHAENFYRDWGKAETFECVILYSDFVRMHFEKAAHECSRATRAVIIPPVVPIIDGDKTERSRFHILHVGRFNPGGHCKRQDVMIEMFRDLAHSDPDAFEIHFAGSLGTDSASREYLADLEVAAKGLHVHFHVNCSIERLRELFLSADVYWHATGIGELATVNPERFEHFGIAIVEAMSAGVIPISLNVGGPAEIIQESVDGFLAEDQADFVTLTKMIVTMDARTREKFRAAARSKALRYSEDAFKQRVLGLLNGAGDPA